MKRLVFYFLFSGSCLAVFSQDTPVPEKYDSTYYERYPHKLAIGPILSKKNTTFAIGSKEQGGPLRYSTNTPTRVGVSVGYDWLSVSASVGLGTLDPDYKKDKGKTKSINFQWSVTGQSVLADLHFQVNKGLYLRGEQDPSFSSEPYYVRPDIRTQIFGVTVRKILNSRQFSIKPPFVFDTWQKRSAGSFMLGGEFVYGSARGDSALVPAGLAQHFPDAAVNHMHYIMFGPTLAYAHSFVISNHFFVTAVASVNGDAAQTFEQNTSGDQKTRWYFTPNISMRGAIGYNARDWELVASAISNRFFIGANEKDIHYQNYSDQFRLAYIRRINAGKAIPAAVNWGRKIIETLGFGFLID
ncbi:hypothetical protein A8C56_23015 [Niabella ginsenosidivorans]|uniref:DUF4421 domain-containing protein n=1 Tax=Niabella ginsenosidivorans TaxID=1176587 RepID=A0A1A9I804_9BACT|nr:DUF4421 family protein [Niabella ginsenosidivorans]ANH83465.1 hypothetical protein A8C56_23015 [Niabella ginsenosidivorans]